MACHLGGPLAADSMVGIISSSTWLLAMQLVLTILLPSYSNSANWGWCIAHALSQTTCATLFTWIASDIDHMTTACTGGGLQGKANRRNMSITRQAGSALKIPAGIPMMGGQPMQPGSFADYGQSYGQGPGQNYGAVPQGHIPAYPMQYAPPNAAFTGQHQPHMMSGQYCAALPSVGYGSFHNPRQSSPDRHSKKSRLPGGQTNYMQQAPPGYPPHLPGAYNMQQAGGYRPQGMQGMHPSALQQRAEAVQQFQMQQYQQMEASVMQQLQHKQDNALLKYGNFDSSQYRQQDLQSRPEFRTY